MTDAEKIEAATEQLSDAWSEGEQFMGMPIERVDDAFRAGVAWRDKNPNEEILLTTKYIKETGEEIHSIPLADFVRLQQEFEAYKKANPGEKVQALVEALEKLAAHCGREWCDVCDERSLHCELGGAQEAIKKWRGE